MTIDGSVYFSAPGSPRLLRYKQDAGFDMRTGPGQAPADRSAGVQAGESWADQGLSDPLTIVDDGHDVTHSDSGLGSDAFSLSTQTVSASGHTRSTSSRSADGGVAPRAANQPSHVKLEQLAEWILRRSAGDGEPLPGVVQDLIEAYRRDEDCVDINRRNQAFSHFVRSMTALDNAALSSIHIAFAKESALFPLRKVNQDIALAVDRLPHWPDQSEEAREAAMVKASVDTILTHVFRPVWRHDTHIGSPSCDAHVSRAHADSPQSAFISVRDATTLAGRDCVTVGLTTLVREAIRTALNSAPAQQMGIGGKIALALAPTTLSVFLVAKDIVAHGTGEGRWRSGTQVCRLLLALTALTTPAFILGLGQSPSLAATFSSTLPTFAYTLSRDVLQTYMPAGRSWQKNLLGVVAVTAAYSAAQLAFAKIMGALSSGLAALRESNQYDVGTQNATHLLPCSTLSDQAVDAVEDAVSDVLAPSGWDIAAMALGTSVINWGVEYADNLCRPALYWVGERISRLQSVATEPIAHTDASNAVGADASPSTFVQRVWNNNGLRSCTFLGIVGLMGMADQYSTLNGHDDVARAETHDVALVTAMMLMAGLYAGAQEDVGIAAQAPIDKQRAGAEKNGPDVFPDGRRANGSNPLPPHDYKLV